MFVLPKLVGLISDGEEKEIELIEERVLSAAKDYVNYMDGSFYTKLFKEGDTNYIYKTDLIKSGLLDKEEITRLDTFAGVKGELLEDDKIKYTVEYINAEPEEYTNEELYLMYQNMNDRLNNLGGGSTGGSGESVDTSVIDDLQSQINENKNSIQNNTTSIENNTSSINTLKDKNSFLDAYPVGSVFISDTNTNPGTIYGGTWTLVDKKFKNYFYNSSTNTNITMVIPTSNISNNYFYMIRKGDTIRFRMLLVNAVAFSDTNLELGTINLGNFGVSNLTLSYKNFSCGTDNGNGIALIDIDTNTGVVTLTDVITKTSEGTIPAGSNIWCDITVPIALSHMLDSAAGEFHFKRTA